METTNGWLRTAELDPELMQDFAAICGFGGRLAGSGGDEVAMNWALNRLRAIGPNVSRVDIPYDGWRCNTAGLELLADPRIRLACNPLLRSMSTPDGGLTGEVLDLGLGRVQDFDRAGDAVRGKIVLVSHEYPFSPGHLHRRRKYDLAVARGAIAFLIANRLPGGGLLSGSSGRPLGGSGIPAAYIDYESVVRIAAAPSPARVRLRIDGEELPGSLAGVGVLDLKGGSTDKIVISAHIDGHNLGQSALDNATGVVVALAAARALAGRVGPGTHGLRICFFSAEEWALAGSAGYLAALEPSELASLRLDINLDTVAGDDRLTALISGFPALQKFVEKSAALADIDVATYLPLMSNSDHANFAARGIPALRLVAGFDRPESRVNNILSAGDVPAVVYEDELRRAVRVTCAMTMLGLKSSDAELAAMSGRTTNLSVS